MNKTIKKIISVILAMITVVSVLSISVYAEDNEYANETVSTAEETNDENPFSDMNILQATEASLIGLAAGVVSLPLLALAPITFIGLPQIGITMVLLPTIGFSSVYYYFEALFTGQFWD